MKNKVNVGIIVIIFLIIILTIGIIFIEKDEIKEAKNDYELEIINIGRKYYKESFYPTIDDALKDLQEFSEDGLIFDLKTLNEYQSFSGQLKTYLSKYKCSYDNSKIFIYPEPSFEENDFDIELYLDCIKR